MAKYLISYDVKEGQQAAAKNALKNSAQNWTDWIESASGKDFRLANTTLICTSSLDRSTIFDKAIAAMDGAGVSIEKLVVVDYVGATFRSDEKR
jgi:hypothetical protein